MRKISKPLAVAGGILALVAVSAGSATAASLITSADIKDGTVRSVDVKDGGIHLSDLSPKVRAILAEHASIAGVQTNWVAKDGAEIVDAHTLNLTNEGTPAGASVEIEDLNKAVQSQHEISFTYELKNGAVYGGGAPRVFVEIQGDYINTFDGAPEDAGVDNGDGTFTKTVTIGKNGRIGAAGVVMDFGPGSVTITNLTINGQVLDFA